VPCDQLPQSKHLELADEGSEPRNGLLTLCLEKRLTAAEALQFKWDVNVIPGIILPKELPNSQSWASLILTILTQIAMLLCRFTEHPVPKEQALMPTWPDKEAARHVSRPARKQPSPDPRLQPSASTVANRAAEIGTLFSKPGATVS